MNLDNVESSIAIGEGAKVPSPRWGFWPRILLIVILLYCRAEYSIEILLSWLLSVIVYWPFLWLKSPNALFYYELGIAFAYVLVDIAITYLGLRLFDLSLEDIGITRFRWETFYQAILALLLMGTFVYYYIAIEDFLAAHGHWPGNIWFTWKISLANFADLSFWNHKVIYWITAGAIRESLTDQGLLYSALRKRLKPLSAMILTSLFFALNHQHFYAQETPIMIIAPAQFLIGFILCSLREFSGNIWTPMAAHFLNDFSGFWLQWWWVR